MFFGGICQREDRVSFEFSEGPVARRGRYITEFIVYFLFFDFFTVRSTVLCLYFVKRANMCEWPFYFLFIFFSQKIRASHKILLMPSYWWQLMRTLSLRCMHDVGNSVYQSLQLPRRPSSRDSRSLPILLFFFLFSQLWTCKL